MTASAPSVMTGNKQLTRLFSGECGVTREELDDPADSSVNASRLLVTDVRPAGIWPAVKSQSSYFPGSLFPRTNPAWVVRRAILPLGQGASRFRDCAGARGSHIMRVSKKQRGATHGGRPYGGKFMRRHGRDIPVERLLGQDAPPGCLYISAVIDRRSR